LRIQIPSKILVSPKGTVTIWPKPPKDISAKIDCKFNLRATTLTSLRLLTSRPFIFNADPHFDPLERILTPGTGEKFREQVLERAGILDPVQKVFFGRLLEDAILPVHETDGHVEVNLDYEKSAFEFKCIWIEILSCLMFRMDSFLDLAPKEIMLQYYINPEVHELYAILKEESVWKKVLENTKIESYERLYQTIKGMQDRTVVRLLKFLKVKTNNDLPKFLSVVDNTIVKYGGSLSNDLPRLLKALADGVEIDDLEEHMLRQGIKNSLKSYFKIMNESARKSQELDGGFGSPGSKAILTTHMSLSFDDSSMTIAFFSQHYGQESVDDIAIVTMVREAKRLLERSNVPYSISPFSSMERAWDPLLEDLAEGRDHCRRCALPTNYLDDRARFYKTWRPALLQARSEIFDNGENAIIRSLSS
jgi:hypothetical protein